MAESDELKASYKKEIETLDDFLGGAKDITDVVPAVEERKRETQAKLDTVNEMPEDELSEVASKLLKIQQEDQARLEQSLPVLPRFEPSTTRYLITGTSGSAFYDATVFPAISGERIPPWASNAGVRFGQLAETKSRKTDLPDALERLQANLGNEFRAAVDSVQKAQAGILGVDQAAIRMRDVIDQLWGSIADLARGKDPHLRIPQRFAVKKQSDRALVAGRLARAEDTARLTLVLDELYGLSSELSGSDFGKNPLNTDTQKLQVLYTRWLLQIDSLLTLIELPHRPKGEAYSGHNI